MSNWRIKFQNFMQRLMWGRNGMDDLGKAALAVYFLLYVLQIFVKQSWLYWLSLAMAAYVLFRIFSRNVGKRREENRTFVNGKQVVKMNFTQRKTHRIFLCRQCKGKVRVPKGKGRIEITCPLCGCKMIHRT